jgi:hypothetical protein
MKDFLEGIRVYQTWIPAVVGRFPEGRPRWKLLSKHWEVRTQGQLKNRRGLPVPQLFLT